MAFWKQLILTIIFLAVAGFAYARLVPGANAQLTRLGIEPSVVAKLTGVAEGGQEKPAAGPGAGRRGGGFGGGRQALVSARPVSTGVINDRATAIGNSEALRSVTIVPRASGILTDILIEPGQMVETGSVVARLDSGSEEIARDRADLALKTARQSLERLERLFKTRTASQSQLDDARNAVRAAELTFQQAELDLQKRRIVAPISGHIGLVPVEAGDYVTAQTEIATLDDRSAILVDFWLPERFVPVVSVGQKIEARALSIPGNVLEGRVKALGSRIDTASRTMQVRAEIANPDDRLRPGMSFRINMQFEGQVWPAVDPLAIQWSSRGAHVWRATDGKAERIPVSIIQRNSDSVLVDGPLNEGELVITEGLQSLRPGAAITIAGQERKKEGKGQKVSDAQ